jgi:antitoxin component of MazEF toxin-antitoxin module
MANLSLWKKQQAFAAEQYVRVERLGNSLFIDIPRAAAGRYHPGAIHQEISVSIPDSLNVEVARCLGDLQIHLPRR